MRFVFYLRNKTLKLMQRLILGRIFLSLIRRPHSGLIRLISATRLDEESFWQCSALGQSLIDKKNNQDFCFHISFNNKEGLSSVYNYYIQYKFRNDILIFVHDDVWLDSTTWPIDIRNGLAHFDVIGVAGNRRLTDQQPAWSFRHLDGDGFHWDHPFLSGSVGHGQEKNGELSNYGHAPAQCQALDGVLIAASCRALLMVGVRFDERFDFHFYDLDFCRNATKNHLSLGTWPISITHQSAGAFGTTDWHIGYRKYLMKWGREHLV